MLTEMPQELMTPDEAAEWFRRSTAWLRRQPDLVRLAGAGGQPLYHVRVCRAYVLGKMRGLATEALRAIQIAALAADCGLAGAHEPRCEMPLIAPPPAPPR